MKRSEKQLALLLIKQLDGLEKKERDQTMKSFIELLASRNELSRVRGIIEALENAWKQMYGAASITIETPFPLSPATRKKLETLAQGATIKEYLKPELIGGVRMKVDEKIIDGSLEGRLLQLSNLFRNA